MSAFLLQRMFLLSKQKINDDTKIKNRSLFTNLEDRFSTLN